MALVQRWWMVLGLLAGLLLPGASALRLCVCDGWSSFSPCACEAPAAADEDCCSARSRSPAPPTNQDGERALAGGECGGCVAINFPEMARRLAANAPPALASEMPSSALQPLPTLLHASLAHQRAERGRDPPWRRRNRELRV